MSRGQSGVGGEPWKKRGSHQWKGGGGGRREEKETEGREGGGRTGSKSLNRGVQGAWKRERGLQGARWEKSKESTHQGGMCEVRAKCREKMRTGRPGQRRLSINAPSITVLSYHEGIIWNDAALYYERQLIVTLGTQDSKHSVTQFIKCHIKTSAAEGL